MEAITDLVHAHTNEKNPIPAANEGDCDVFMLLSFCVAKVMAIWMGCFIHTCMGGLGTFATA